MAKIRCEGQEFDLPDEVAKNDKMLKDTMVSFFPQVANAKIERKEVNGVLTVTLIKQAGTKGIDHVVHQMLVNAAEHLNPALALQEKMLLLDAAGKLTVQARLEMSDEIDWAISVGGDEIRLVEGAGKVLDAAAPIPAQGCVIGF